jgi:SMC interacting uncharacterized protein involved in chromosome segregation
MSQTREDQLQTKINDLRNLIRRINYESNLTFKKLQEENMNLREELQQMKLAYSVLDQNCERFQKAINYWKYIYEEEKEEAEVKGGSKCEDRKEMEGPKEVCV